MRLWASSPAWAWALAVIAVLSILIGSLSGMAEDRVRNALAFQMTSGIGHILIGAVLLTSVAASVIGALLLLRRGRVHEAG